MIRLTEKQAEKWLETCIDAGQEVVDQDECGMEGLDCKVCWECLYNMDEEEWDELAEALSVRLNAEVIMCPVDLDEEGPEVLGEFCCDPGEDVTDRINDVLLQAGFERRVLSSEAPSLYFLQDEDDPFPDNEPDFDRTVFRNEGGEVTITVAYYNYEDA